MTMHKIMIAMITAVVIHIRVLCLQICKFADLLISKTLLLQVSQSSISPAMPASEHPCLQPLYAACREVHSCMLWNGLFLSFFLKAELRSSYLPPAAVAYYRQQPCSKLLSNPYHCPYFSVS